MDAGALAAEFVQAVHGLPGAVVSAPATAQQVDRVEAFAGTRLPELHRATLLQANGLGACWGYRRIFGVGDAAQDIGPWNAHETWKFAWTRPLEDFLSIGQTGWGDQFAYKLSDLRKGVETIWWLDRFLMEAAKAPVADNFEMFLREFYGGAQGVDENVQEARRQIGDLGPHELAIFSPSPLLVGLERATQLLKMPARGALVINGDMATQLLDKANASRKVDRFDIYIDGMGRLRMSVKWAYVPSNEPDPTPDAG